MKITAIRTTDLGFSKSPQALKRNLVSSTSLFDGYEDQTWFGPGVFMLVGVDTDQGITDIGTAGGFTATAKPIVDTLLSSTLVGENPENIEDNRHSECLWDQD